MASNNSPELFPSERSSSSISPPNGSIPRSSGSYFHPHDAPIEHQRGGSASVPPLLHFFPAEVGHRRSFEEDEEEESSPFELMRKFQVPMNQRRRIPGCGINPFDINDQPVRAETSPVRKEEIFGSSVRCYARPRRLVQNHPISYRYGFTTGSGHQQQQPLAQHASAILQTSESLRVEEEQLKQRQQYRDPRYYPFFHGQLSPYTSLFSSTSSSSLSKSSSPSPPLTFQQFQPVLQSSFLQSPSPAHQQRILQRHIRQLENRTPAYIPSFSVHSPTHYSSPPCLSAHSDQSVFEATPQSK